MRRSTLYLNDGTQRISFDRFDDYMHVVGHDAPRKQAIAVTIEVEHGVLYQRRDCRILQPARTQTAVQVFVGLGEVVGLFGQHLGDCAWQAVEKPNVTNWIVSADSKCGR